MFSLVTASFGLFSRAVQKILGAQLLTDLSGFVAALDSMFGGFRQRADETYRILQDPQTAFLLVAAPERDAVREAAYFAGAAGGRADAAGRPGAQPDAPLGPAGALRPSESEAAAAALDAAGDQQIDRGRAAGPRGPDAADRAGGTRGRHVHRRLPGRAGGRRSRRSPPTSTTSTGCGRSAALLA